MWHINKQSGMILFLSVHYFKRCLVVPDSICDAMFLSYILPLLYAWFAMLFCKLFLSPCIYIYIIIWWMTLMKLPFWVLIIGQLQSKCLSHTVNILSNPATASSKIAKNKIHCNQENVVIRFLQVFHKTSFIPPTYRHQIK